MSGPANWTWGPLADRPPEIVELLQAVRDRAKSSPDRVQRMDERIKAILDNWERDEDIEQLKRDLGLNLTKKRRREVTVKNELRLANAVVNAALIGEINPKRAAAEKLGIDERQVQRAWKAWGSVCLASLKHLASIMSDAQRAALEAANEQPIEAAIERLSRGDKNS